MLPAVIIILSRNEYTICSILDELISFFREKVSNKVKFQTASDQISNKINSDIIVDGYIRRALDAPSIINEICLSYYCFQPSALKINDKVDHRDFNGKWCIATIIDKKQDNMLKIHYDGYSEKWDIWSDSKTEIYKFAVFKSESNRTSVRFNKFSVGDNVDIDPAFKQDDGWRKGKIAESDEDSGQLRIKYLNNNEATDHIWIHADNILELKERSNDTEDSSISKSSDHNQNNYRIHYNFRFDECDRCGSTSQLKRVSAGTFCWSCRYDHWSGNKRSRGYSSGLAYDGIPRGDDWDCLDNSD